MKTNIQQSGPTGIVQPSGDSPQPKVNFFGWRNSPGHFAFAALCAGLLLLLSSAPAARAHESPVGCTGSGLGILLFTDTANVHIGDTINYSATVFNGLNSGLIVCDATAILAFIVTPDGVSHPIALVRTSLASGQSDPYPNVVSYVVRAQDIQPDATVRATATDTGVIHQNDSNSQGGGNQGVNTEVSLPCIGLAVQCVGGVGENGAITFSGTVTNCGNNTLVGVTVTNFVNGGPVHVTFINTLLTNQTASFSGSWIPLNPCVPSTATFTAQGVDQYTTHPRTVTSSANTTCAEVLTPGIRVTKTCSERPAAPGQLLTFFGSVSNTGNVTLTGIVVVNNQPVAKTTVFTVATLAPGAVTNFTGSYLAPTNCSVTDTLTATGQSSCGVAVTNTATATCPITTTPQIAVTAACPTAPVVSGGSVTYSGTVQNTGNNTLTNVVVVSDQPAANTTVFTVATLAPGASANFNATYTVPVGACSVTTTFSGTGNDICSLNGVTNTVVTTCAVNTAPAIGVTLACPAVPATAGGLITYTGFVTNSGNVTLNNVIVVNNQVTVLTVPSLAAHASANFTASFITPTDGCSVSSTVTATGYDNCTQAQVSNTASATCALATTPGLAITQFCPESPALPGGPLTYSGTVSNSGNVTLGGVVVNSVGGGGSATNIVNTIWFDDALPAGAVTSSTGGDSWTWVTSNPTPFSGVRAHQSNISAGQHQHGFINGTAFAINSGKILVAYVYLDPANVPSEVMLQWYDGSFAHRAYWGANSVAVGTDGTDSRRYMGLLPAVGQWVRLEVPASLVGLEGHSISGMIFTLYGGRATWDAVGKANVNIISTPATNTLVFATATLAPGASTNFNVNYTVPINNGCSFTSTLNSSATNICNGAQITANVTTTCSIPTTPQITVTAACPDTQVVPGGSVTYSGTVQNTGNITLTNVVVVSDRPAANTIVFAATTLAPGESANFNGTYTVPANACSVTTTFSGTGNDICSLNGVTNTVATTCAVTTAPAIGVTLACPVVPATAGGLITYTGFVTNSGNVTLNNVTVINNQASPSTVLTVPSLAAHTSANFTASFITPTDGCSVSSSVMAVGSDNCTKAMVTNTASATCPLITTPGIRVTKTCSERPAIPGGLLTYSGSVANTGNVTLTNIVVVNNQPVANTVVFTAASLAPGVVTNFTGSYLAPTNCSVTDTLTGTGRSICGVAVNNSASATCSILTTPQIAVTANCPTAPVVPGGTLTYSGTVQNTGNITLTNVVVVSDQPVANTVVFTRATLAPGVSTNFTATYTVPANACSVTTTFSGTGNDICSLNGVTNTVVTTCTVITAPAIGVTLACPVVPATAGGLITYTGFVTNSGNVTLNNVTVINNQASPSTVLTVPSLAAHTSANFTASFITPTDGCSVSSSVMAVGSDNCTKAMVTNTASATCPLVTTPGIKVTKVCSERPAIPGGTLTYSGSVSNTGNVTLTNIVVVNNQPVANTTVFTVATLAPGAVTNFTGSYVSPTNCSVADTLTATGRSVCGVAVTNSATATCPITTVPAIAVTQVCPVNPAVPGGLLTYSGSVSNAGNIMLTNVIVLNNLSGATPVFTVATLSPGAVSNYTGSYLAPASCASTSTSTATGQSICGVAVTNTASTTCPITTTPGIKVTKVCPVKPVSPGQLLTFSGSVSNTGNVTLTGIVVVNNQPAANTTVFTVAALAPGAVTNFTGSYLAPTNCSVTDTLTATGQSICGVAVTNTATATCPILTTPGIKVTKVCPVQPVSPGQLLTFSGSVSNTGNVTLTNIVVVNNQPVANTTVFTVAALAPGAVTNFTGSYVAPTNCSVADTLTATGQSICGVAVTNTATATCPILTTPAIVVTQACPTTPVVQGGILTYSGSVSNAGNITLTNIVVVNNWPAANTVIFTLASLAPGATANFTGSYQVPVNCCVAWSTVAASGQGCDGVTVTDTDTGTCTVFTSPQIVVTKVCAPGVLRPGDLLTYSGSVSNAGNITLVNVTVVDNQPVLGSTLLTINFLAPGESQTYTGSYTVPPDFCGEDTVTASGFDSCSYALVTSSATATCSIAHSPRIAVTKNCPPLPIPHGGQVIYSGTVSNAGNVTLINVFVVDNQPSNNAPVIGPITLAPGAAYDFSGSYTAPLVCCETTDTVTARGQDRCSGSNVTATATTICPTLYTPGIALVQPCPPYPLPMGSVYVFSGFVTNTGDAILTNVVVFSSQAGTNLTLLGPLDLAPGEAAPYTGSLTVPFNICAVTVTVTSQETCKGTWITNTTSCPIATTPVITITEDCPPGPVTNGSSVAFGGSVCNSGNITLTNILVFSGQPSNFLVLGPITLLPGACAPFTGSYLAIGGSNPTTNSIIVTSSSVIITPTNTVTITPTNTVTVTPTNTVTITPTNTVTVTPTNTVTVTPTNTVTVTTNNTVTVTTNNTVTVTTNAPSPTSFGTINTLNGAVVDRFLIGSNFNGLTYDASDAGYGATEFYSMRKDTTGASYFDTIIASTATTTDRFGATTRNFDALTYAADDVGYGPLLFYYLSHDTAGISWFGTITPGGVTGVTQDLFPVGTNANFDALTYTATDEGYGADMFYYIRHDANGVSWFGTINPTPGGIVADRFTIGTNTIFDGLVFTPLTAPGYGANNFYYLRHDTNGVSTFGTIFLNPPSPPTSATVTDRFTVGTNATELTFTADNPAFGANLFYFLRGSGRSLATNTVSGFVTNTVSGFVTNTVSGFVTNTVSGFVTNTVSGFVTNTVSGFVTNTVSGFVTNTVSGFITNTVSGFVTNTVTTYTTNSVVSFTPTNTVTATGMDICQNQTVVATANCVGSVVPTALIIGTPNVNSDGFYGLSFPTETGKTYTVQYKNTLADPTWTDLVPPGSVPGTGGPLTIYDSSAAALHQSRFYRIMVTP